MREMPLPCHNHIVVLKRVNPPGSLIATLVRPLVQLLRKIDETNRRRHPQQYIRIINCYNARHRNRKCCLTNLVDIIAHLPVRDGPREFVMPLEGFYLRPEYGRVLGAIIIHGPVIHSRAQIRKLVPNQHSKDSLACYNGIHIRQQHTPFNKESSKCNIGAKNNFALPVVAFQDVTFNQGLVIICGLERRGASNRLYERSRAWLSLHAERHHSPST
mmetsp:Transcript_24338/g.39201  ORF Transcript_24338/g.39201 Transcript_24338/m.39201 type:complete len:216 (+) Transcript_24338:439-1086(+)